MSQMVERVHNITDREFRHEFADRGRPVIISGCIEHWPARQKWDLDYFERRFGDKQVNFSGRQWRIADFVSELRGGVRPAPYLNQVKLDEQFQELIPDVGDLKYTRKNSLRWRYALPRSHRVDRGIRAVFIGGAGSGFGKLHWDYSYLHVYISQVRGPKDFIIFAPEDSQYLYPNPEYMADSLIKNFNDFDIEKYPDVKKATPIRFTVHDGETVFLPGGWWHATKMHELSISVAESSLDRANWKIRSDWFGASYHGGRHPRWKIAGYEAYMSMLGLFA